MKNYCSLQDTCSHGEACESKITNVTLAPMCYDKVDTSELFSEVKRDEPKQELLF